MVEVSRGESLPSVFQVPVQAEADNTLTSLIDALSERPDMQQVLRKLMSPDDMLETFSEQAIADPDLMRVTLQASVAWFQTNGRMPLTNAGMPYQFSARSLLKVFRESNQQWHV